MGGIADVLSLKMEKEGGRRSERKPGLRSVVSCPPLGLISNSRPESCGGGGADDDARGMTMAAGSRESLEVCL